MTAGRRRLAALLAAAAFACIAGTVAASVLGDRWAAFLAVAAVALLVAALAVVRGRGRRDGEDPRPDSHPESRQHGGRHRS